MKKQYIDYLKKNLPKDKFDDGIKRLYDGESPQYIVGNVNFCGYDFEVNSSVLIPRFETELLVEKVINYIKKNFKDIIKLNILDIGTGSGCIAVTLKKELGCSVVASDVSDEALNVARKNAKYNGADVSFVCSDVFSNINGKYDIIISNPPYIKEDENIEKIVFDNEPHLALYASDNGLYFYKKILKDAQKFLKKSFLIAFEIGELQGNEVRNIVYEYFDNVDVIVEKDYSERDRFVFVFSK